MFVFRLEKLWVGDPCDIVTNVLDYDTIESKLELRSHYYVHF